MDPADLERQLRELHDASFAWAVLCSRYDDEEARDLLQASYMKLLDGGARFAGRSSFKTWLFALIRNTAAERHRHRARRFRLLKWWRPVNEAHVGPAEGASHDVREAMLALPDRQREVLHLVFFEDLTVEEAAAAMGVAVGTARQHYARGKKALRHKLDKGPCDE